MVSKRTRNIERLRGVSRFWNKGIMMYPVNTQTIYLKIYQKKMGENCTYNEEVGSGHGDLLEYKIDWIELHRKTSFISYA